MKKPSQWSLAVVCLAMLLPAVCGQCSAYCQSCQGTFNNGQNNNCQSCPNSFESTSGPNSICTPNTTDYPIVLELANGDFSLSDSSTDLCNSLFPTVVPGRFNSGKKIRIYSSNSVPTHYQIRMRGSILFIDNWDSSDKATYLFDNVGKASLRHSSAYTVGGSNACGSSGAKEVYGTLDTNNQPHTNSNLLVEVSVDWCKCSNPGGGSCSSCSWMIPDIVLMISLCNETCDTCFGVSNTQCYNCTNDTVSGGEYLLTNTTCSDTCGYRYYRSGPNVCSKCHNNCTACSNASTNCSSCATGYIFLTINNTCPTSCPPGYYNSSNQCVLCDLSCQKCTGNPTPCQYCATTYFLYNQVCYSVCPIADLVQNPTNRTCQNCSVWCVGLSMSFYQPTGMNGFSYLYVDMNFSAPLDFSTFPMSTFQTISFDNSSFDLSMFNISYTPINGNAYRITLQPLGFSLIVNQTIRVATMGLVSPKHTSADGRPFKDENYNISKSITWTYLRPPDMTGLEQGIVSGFSSFSTEVNNALSRPGLQEIKKLGFMLLLMNSLQITSCLLLVNIILPVNLYEGLRLFASLIFFDVPPWESESTKNKFVMVPPVESLTKRMMQQVGSPMLAEYRFRRTGFTNIFLADCYVQIGLICLSYLILLIFILVGKSKCGVSVKGYLKYAYTAQTSLHQIALMYFTLTIMFEFIYFDVSQPVRYVSLAVCILVTIYYLVYHVHRYHELLKLPLLDPMSPEYGTLVEKYGSILKNIRYQQASSYGTCLPIRAYFQPQCFHVVSYVKKLLMMLVFPFFYDSEQAVLGLLVCIQLLEIVRFCVTWPFAKRWRNWLRLVLQLVLLGVFLIVLGLQQVGTQIFGLNPPATAISLYFNLGWVAFSFVMVFNFGFLYLCIHDLVMGYKYTNRQMVDATRRAYYFQKLKQVEVETGSPPLATVNECVKLGNLNSRYTDDLPDVDFRIEEYNITQKHVGSSLAYQLEINNVMEAAMATTFNYKADNSNVEIVRRFEGIWRINERKHKMCYSIIYQCFEKFAKHSSDTITIKTFSRIEQKKYKLGQTISLQLNSMYQEVGVESNLSEQVQVIQLERLMTGFPIPEGLLRQLDQGLSIEIPLITQFGRK